VRTGTEGDADGWAIIAPPNYPFYIFEASVWIKGLSGGDSKTRDRSENYWIPIIKNSNIYYFHREEMKTIFN